MNTGCRTGNWEALVVYGLSKWIWTNCPDSVHNVMNSNRCNRLNKLCCMSSFFLMSLKNQKNWYNPNQIPGSDSNNDVCFKILTIACTTLHLTGHHLQTFSGCKLSKTLLFAKVENPLLVSFASVQGSSAPLSLFSAVWLKICTLQKAFKQ